MGNIILLSGYTMAIATVFTKFKYLVYLVILAWLWVSPTAWLWFAVFILADFLMWCFLHLFPNLQNPAWKCLQTCASIFHFSCFIWIKSYAAEEYQWDAVASTVTTLWSQYIFTYQTRCSRGWPSGEASRWKVCYQRGLPCFFFFFSSHIFSLSHSLRFILNKYALKSLSITDLLHGHSTFSSQSNYQQPRSIEVEEFVQWC